MSNAETAVEKAKEPGAEKELDGVMERLSINSFMPTVEFVEDMDSFMEKPENNGNAQSAIKRFEEQISRAKILESNQITTKRRLKSQISELDKSLKMIEELKRRKETNESMSSHFRLADHVYLKAKINPVEKIGLWLGANVMLEYDICEGATLLVSKKDKAEDSLKVTSELIDTLREQITTIEVNMARVYNWDVKRRQLERTATEAKNKSN